MIKYKFYTIQVKEEELADELNYITDTLGGIICNIIPNSYAKRNGYNYVGQHLESVLVIYKLPKK